MGRCWRLFYFNFIHSLFFFSFDMSGLVDLNYLYDHFFGIQLKSYDSDDRFRSKCLAKLTVFHFAQLLTHHLQNSSSLGNNETKFSIPDDHIFPLAIRPVHSKTGVDGIRDEVPSFCSNVTSDNNAERRCEQACNFDPVAG